MKKYLFLFTFCFLNLSCLVGRFVIYNFADINDYKKFPSNPIIKSEMPFSFFYADTSKQKFPFPDKITFKGKQFSLDEFLAENKTVAFIIIRNDTVYYEKYFNQYSKESIVPSFSMAKSFVSALVGIAIDEGYIISVNQPITDYIPELSNRNGFEKITIENLLNMRSGIKFNEGYYNPFGDVAKYYYGLNIKKYIKHLKIKEDPDKKFDYISVNTQLLGLLVERATGKSLSEYLQEKIWKPLGMEYDASWSIDSKKNKTEKAYCCINARATDFAKFGRLYLNKGNWNGKQIISKDWVEKSTHITKENKQYHYSYQWWHNVNFTFISDTTKVPENEKIYSFKDEKGNIIKYITTPSGDFFAWGFLGQFIYVYSSKNIIIVRLGKSEKIYWPSFFKQLCEGKITRIR
jgi:CubicO group peptidase (beta-lactamase class C family)